MTNWLLARYEHFTRLIEAASGGDRAAHIHAGLLIWLAASLILRAPLRGLRPILVLTIAETANECVDRYAHGSWRWPDTIGDAATTLFWPVAIMLLLRIVPKLRR